MQRQWHWNITENNMGKGTEFLQQQKK